MDISQDAQVIQSLRTILKCQYGEMKRLKMLKEIESRHRNGTKLSILSHLLRMVPLTQSLESLRRLMMLFSRRMMELLDEMEILSKKEIAEEALQLIKQFWSLCCNQQRVVAPIQTYGKWLPILLEIVTSLASMYIDLFIVSHEHSENHTTLSKRLYSWLQFDLNQRAIKTAFLEVSCPIQKASQLLSPILSKIFATPLDAKSHMDYLLHMLFLRKWSSICAAADIETSRNMKAPKAFVTWLNEQWRDSHAYIPQDKSLKGRRVTEFIMDLDDEAIDSLTDMFSDCLKGEQDTVDITGSTDVGEERLTASHFVVDKKGSGHSSQDSEMLPKPSTSTDAGGRSEEVPGPSFMLDTKGSEYVMQVSDSDDEVQFIKKNKESKPKGQKRKRDSAEQSSILLDSTEEELNYYIIPDRTHDAGSSPKKKKRKVGSRNEEVNGVMFVESAKNSKCRSGSNVGHDEVEILDDEDDARRNDDDNPLGLDVIDFESLTELAENAEEATASVRTKKQGGNSKNTLSKSSTSVSKETTGESGDEEVVELDVRHQQVDKGESDVVEIVEEASRSGKEGKNRAKAKVTKSKPLILSDPVSSYFTPRKEGQNTDIMRICDLTEDSEDAHRIFDVEVSHSKEIEISDESLSRSSGNELQKTPKHRLRSSDKGNIHRGSSKGKETFITIVDDSVKENFGVDEHSKPVVTLSDDDKNGSDKRSSNKLLPSNAIVIPEDSSDSEITFKEDLDVTLIGQSIEDDISRQLSSIRKRVSETSQSEAQSKTSASITPSRRSTRLRTRSEGETSGTDDHSQTERHVRSAKKSRNEGSPVLKGWLKSTPQKLSSEVPISLTSPSKLAEETLGVGTVKGKRTPKPSASTEEKQQNLESPVKNKPAKVPTVLGNEEKRRPSRRSDISSPSLSSIKKKSVSPQNPSSASKTASSSSSSHDSLTEDPNISINTSYSLRTPRKSNPSKSPEKKTSSNRKKHSLSQKTSPSRIELQTSTKKSTEGKLNKSGADQEEPVSTPLITRSKKTPQSSRKSSPKTSPANRRKSLRSVGKAKEK